MASLAPEQECVCWGHWHVLSDHMPAGTRCGIHSRECREMSLVPRALCSPAPPLGQAAPGLALCQGGGAGGRRGGCLPASKPQGLGKRREGAQAMAGSVLPVAESPPSMGVFLARPQPHARPPTPTAPRVDAGGSTHPMCGREAEVRGSARNIRGGGRNPGPIAVDSPTGLTGAWSSTLSTRQLPSLPGHDPQLLSAARGLLPLPLDRWVHTPQQSRAKPPEVRPPGGTRALPARVGSCLWQAQPGWAAPCRPGKWPGVNP